MAERYVKKPCLRTTVALQRKYTGMRRHPDKDKNLNENRAAFCHAMDKAVHGMESGEVSVSPIEKLIEFKRKQTSQSPGSRKRAKIAKAIAQINSFGDDIPEQLKTAKMSLLSSFTGLVGDLINNN